jgi:RNA polymerase sigma factor, sigma-70 family
VIFYVKSRLIDQKLIHEARGRIHSTHSGNQALIYKIATIYTRDREEQRDLYQEVVYQTWKSFDQFKKAAKPSTWLYRVGMNTAITHLNRSKKRVAAVPMEGMEFDLMDETDSQKEEQIRQLYAEIRKLGLLDRGMFFSFWREKVMRKYPRSSASLPAMWEHDYRESRKS